MTDRFPEADYYDCRQSEQLQHETIEEAVHDFLEVEMARDCDVAALIREHSPITVEAYRRKPVSEAWFERQAEIMVENAEGAFSEDFCEADDSPDNIPQERILACRKAVTEAIKTMFAGMVPYDCEVIGKFDLEAEEVEALMREWEPGWFEEDAATPDRETT